MMHFVMHSLQLKLPSSPRFATFTVTTETIAHAAPAATTTKGWNLGNYKFGSLLLAAIPSSLPLSLFLKNRIRRGNHHEKSKAEAGLAKKLKDILLTQKK
jgi:hypothetical protein